MARKKNKTEENSETLKDYTSSGTLRGSMDIPFLMLVLLLFLIGLVAVLSASYTRALYTEGDSTYFFTRQLGLGLAGIVIMFFISRFPMKMWWRFAEFAFAVSIVLLVLVKVAGTTANGAKRWFSVGGITFQPSEIAKIAVILLASKIICQNGRKKMQTFRYGVVPFVIVAGIVGLLLMIEPHLSATLIILFITAVLMWCGGTQKRWFALAIVVGGGGLILYLMLSGSYQSERFYAWQHPFDDITGTGYQIVQSLYAIGSGGLTGLGLGNSRQKAFYLPEEHNDYIFAVWCEEAGFIGAILVLLLFALLICRGYWLAIHCKDKYSFLVCVGITSLLCIQVVLNIAVVTNTIPSTGISLPFFSYGGTALILQLAEMGMILSISRDIPYDIEPAKKRGEITPIRPQDPPQPDTYFEE